MSTPQDLSHLLPDVINIARAAGQLILDIYQINLMKPSPKVIQRPSPAPI